MKPKTDKEGRTTAELSKADVALLRRGMIAIHPVEGHAADDTFHGISSVLITHGPGIPTTELSDKERELFASLIDRLLCFVICEGEDTSAADDAKIAVNGLREVLKPLEDDE